MAINVSFNGATIYKPGAYSKLDIDLGGGFPLGPAGLIAIFGESTSGTPGASEADISRVVYTAEQLPEIKAKYGEGQIVDACQFLFSPATDAAIPSGAQAVWIFKTNAAAQASRLLKQDGIDYTNMKANEYGVGGNRITQKVEHIKEVAPTLQGSVDVPAFGAALDGTQIDVIVNGGAVDSVTIAGSPATIGDLLTELNATLTGAAWTNVGDMLVLTVDADATAHKNGTGKSVQVTMSAGSDLGFTSGEVSAYSATEASAMIEVTQQRDLVTESDSVGGAIMMEVAYRGVAATASIVVGASDIQLKEAAVTIATLDYVSYPTLAEMIAGIKLESDWDAKVSSTLAGQLSPSILDQVTTDVKSQAGVFAGRVKRDKDVFQDFLTESTLIDGVVTAVAGLPDETLNGGGNVVAKPLQNGSKGATTTASIVDALTAFEEVRVNSVIPLMSRDATADIADGLTDVGSTYTIEGIHQAVKSHLSTMSSTARKSERQGYVSQKLSFFDAQEVAANLADDRMQLVIQDVRQNDSNGAIKWFQPWALSCLLAGARGGSPVGTPMTFKFLNCSGIRHTAQSMSTPEADIVADFNPRTQYNQAIKAGITFMENPPTGGFRVVVDNTTYGKDGNWVKNRGNTRYAADILSFDFRRQVEDIFVGIKNIINVSEIKSTCESILATFLAQGITVSTADAPNGYKGLVVKLEGNVIRINFVAKLVEGIDFVLTEITVQRATGEA